MCLSVIIPSLNSQIVDQVIGGLTKQSALGEIAEVLIVGQDKPGRLPKAGQCRLPLRLIETPQPVSAATARNLGARQAHSEWLAFLDADCIPAPDWASLMLAAFAQGHLAVGGGMDIEPDQSDYWTLCDNLLALSPSIDEAPERAQWYLLTGNFGIQRALFLELNGFDESFPGAAGEDVDFSLRLQQRGHALHFEPKARVTHRHKRASARAVWRHFRSFGAAHDRIQQLHGAFRPSPLNHLSPRLAPAIALASPMLAANDVRRLFGSSQLARRNPQCAPGLWWGMLGWYAGLTSAMKARAT